jgi:hypothetical protein
LLLRSPVEIVCPKNRRFPKGTIPKLKDFRHEKFLSIASGYAFGYEQWLRELCKQVGGFEPEIAALADSHDSLIGWWQQAQLSLGNTGTASDNTSGSRNKNSQSRQ